MLEKGIKNDLLFMDALKREAMDKGEIFAGLYSAIGREVDIKKLHLPSSPNIVRLQSNLIKGKFKINQPRIAGYINKILHAENNNKEELGVMLKSMVPEKRELVVMAMDNYLSLDSKHNLEGFYEEYEDFRKEMQKDRGKETASRPTVLNAAIRDNLILRGSAALM